MFLRLGLAAAATIALTGVAMADPILGDWRTEPGAIASIAPCGDEICITLTTGDHAGK